MGPFRLPLGQVRGSKRSKVSSPVAAGPLRFSQRWMVLRRAIPRCLHLQFLLVSNLFLGLRHVFLGSNCSKSVESASFTFFRIEASNDQRRSLVYCQDWFYPLGVAGSVPNCCISNLLVDAGCIHDLSLTSSTSWLQWITCCITCRTTENKNQKTGSPVLQELQKSQCVGWKIYVGNPIIGGFFFPINQPSEYYIYHTTRILHS